MSRCVAPALSGVPASGMLLARSRWGRVALVVWLAAGVLAGCGEAFTLDEERVPLELVPLFQSAAERYPILSAAQLAAQARVESKFDPYAKSRAGAEGIMQFLPTTWDEFGDDGNGDGLENPLEPADAIVAAAKYEAHLADLVAHLPGDKISLILAAYNAGPAAVQAAGGIPDYAETRQYVRKVNNWAGVFDKQL
jgi:soluble lytic murein transglycosylase-like protein